MANGAVVRDRVQAILAGSGVVGVHADGKLSVDAGSTRCFVRVLDKGDITIVQVCAPILQGVKPSPELWEFVARNGAVLLFGHLVAADNGDQVDVMIVHNLLGDYLDPDELSWAVHGIGSVADQLDDQLQSRFGGNRWGR